MGNKIVMKIYVITHKSFDKNLIKNKKIYYPLLVGVENGNKGESSYLRDNFGSDNISSRNKSFCELTGIYWVWKNQDNDIVGFNHYRRYFVNKDKELLTEENIKAILDKYDVILPKRDPYAFLGKTAAQYFGDRHDPLIWTLCRDIIKDKYENYLDDFDWYSNQYQGYSFNMIIARQSIINEYNKWMFDILFELSKEINIEKYTGYNQRMWGFLSERLINVWIHHKMLKVYECPVLFTGRKSILKSQVRKYISKYWKRTHLIYKNDNE